MVVHINDIKMQKRIFWNCNFYKSKNILFAYIEIMIFIGIETEDHFADVSKMVTCGKKNFLLYK